MKRTNLRTLLTAVAVGTAAWAAPLAAQDDFYYVGGGPAGLLTAQPAAGEPADAPPPGTPVDAAACDACDPCADDCCQECCSCFLFGDGTPWTLCCPDNPVRVGGWMQWGYHTGGPDGRGDGLFNNYPHGIRLHQGWVWLDKALDLDNNDYDWGYHVDYVYGIDGPKTQAFGQDQGWDVDWDHGSFYGSAIPQAYVEVGAGDLTVKLGHFYTIIGYEVVQAPQNFFYSRSVTLNRAEPFTHTGALASYKVGDHVTVHGGWTAGWDTAFRRDGGSTFLGGFTLQLLDNLKFAYATTVGDFGYSGASDSNGYAHSLVLQWQITEKLLYVAQSDYVDNDEFLGYTDDIIGLNQYLIYQCNECWGLGMRLEYFDDPRQQGNDWELTCGVNYRPHANVVLRPEYRLIEGDDAFDDFFPRRSLFGVDCIVTF